MNKSKLTDLAIMFFNEHSITDPEAVEQFYSELSEHQEDTEHEWYIERLDSIYAQDGTLILTYYLPLLGCLLVPETGVEVNFTTSNALIAYVMNLDETAHKFDVLNKSI